MARLYAESYYGDFFHEHLQESLDDATQTVRSDFEQSPECCFVILNSNNECMGGIFCYIGSTDQGKVLNLDSVQILPEFRKQGLAQKLMQQVLETALEEKVVRVEMFVDRRETQPALWYRNMGFEFTGKVQYTGLTENLKLPDEHESESLPKFKIEPISKDYLEKISSDKSLHSCVEEFPQYCLMAQNNNGENVGAIFCKIVRNFRGPLLQIESVLVEPNFNQKEIRTELMKAITNIAKVDSEKIIGITQIVDDPQGESTQYYNDLGLSPTGWVEYAAPLDEIKL